MNFLYTIDPTADEPIMLINKHIGYDKDEKESEGIIGHQFEQELLTLDGMNKKCIKIYINSPGGSVLDGMSIYNAILKSKTSVHTYCTGVAASIAAVIFEAGQNRIMADYAKLMYHNPYNTQNNKDHSLDIMKDALVKMIAGRNRKGKTEEEISAAMDKTTWMSAYDAVTEGFADEIETSSHYNINRLHAIEDMKSMWQEANTILNKLFDIPKPTSMLRVKNKLRLDADATEESIVQAINKLEADLAAAQNKATDAEEKWKEERARHLVDRFVKSGKIRNDADTITKWVNKAKEDYEGVEEMLATLQGNKTAAKIDIHTSNSIDALRTSQAALTMAELRNSIQKN